MIPLALWHRNFPPLHQPLELLMRACSEVQSSRQQKCRSHGRRWDNATATDYNVSQMVTMIGDSVNLRAQDYFSNQSDPGHPDWCSGESVENGMKVLKPLSSNKVLLKCGHCPRNQYCKQLQRIAGSVQLRNFKRPSFWSCDTIWWSMLTIVQWIGSNPLRIELAKRCLHFITIADWYHSNWKSKHWVGTDSFTSIWKPMVGTKQSASSLIRPKGSWSRSKLLLSLETETNVLTKIKRKSNFFLRKSCLVRLKTLT